jgi:hypothetical protein
MGMKKILIACAIVFALGAAGIAVQLLLSPVSYAGDPKP